MDILGWGFLGITTGATYGACMAANQGYLGTETGRRMLYRSVNVFGSAGVVYGTTRALLATAAPDADEYVTAGVSGMAAGMAVGLCMQSRKAAVVAGGAFATLAVLSAMVDREVPLRPGSQGGPRMDLWRRCLPPEELERRQQGSQ